MSNATESYDDDRPGMMRVHVAQERGEALAAKYTLATLRRIARERRVSLAWSDGTKVGVAVELALAGVKP